MPRVYQPSDLPPTAVYIAALSALRDRVNGFQRRLLEAQYRAPNRSATAPQLADLVGVESYSGVNVQYGRLGHLLCDEMGYEPSKREIGTHRWWSALSVGYETADSFLWQMHPQVAEALEALGWCASAETALPEEVPEAVAELFREGAVRTITINAYERDPRARLRCIEHHGARCAVCRFDFEATYGKIGRGFIHVHHMRPLSEIGEEYEVDPTEDLCPVCPNCHAIIHRRTPALEIDEVKRLLERRGRLYGKRCRRA